MKARLIAGLSVLTLTLTVLAAHADNDPRVNHVLTAINRIPPAAAGEERTVTLVYGPYVIPPGQDNNRVTVDVPIQTGFYTSVFPNLVDIKTGKEPTEQEAHIHHAHWFRVTNDKGYEYNNKVGPAGLSWVFGTGEERTGGTLKDRESTAEGWRYGIFLDASTPQALIFMIHNKTAAPLEAYITLSINMVYGTRDQIKAATGKDIHPLRGVLTGTTQDVAANLNFGGSSKNGVLMQDYTADFSGTLIAAASHMHPGGKWVYVTNLGPKGPDGKLICGGKSIGGDGIPGSTLFVSKKVDHVKASWPYSEDYQMGGTQGGFRAPVHEGDIIRQYGVYDVNHAGANPTGDLPASLFRKDPLDPSSPLETNSIDGKTHAWYQAMSYTGLYSDTENKPALPRITNASQCTAGNFAPKLIPSAGFNAAKHANFLNDPTWSGTNNPLETHITHDWLHDDKVCGVNDPAQGGTVPCDRPVATHFVNGSVTDTIHVGGFVYLPGDLSVTGLDGSVTVPLVKKGSTVRLLNDDIAIGVRHTFTSCPAPCDGSYFANYPLPDGLYDSGKLGNLDYIDGGLFQGNDTLPMKDLVIDNRFKVGSVFNYFCSIHPWMRGAFKVVA
ncbi:MAG: hypothetical protein NVSMB57_04190 [Actinomycetota bacterium]